jgi:CobQ-like glutamine amidotransferase family enzyme
MRPFTIIVLAPSLLNTNGDSENARVLATRIGWAGGSADVVAVETLADLPDDVDAVVIGSGSDSSTDAARELLLGMQSELRTWSTEGVPILAVGLGWELLSWGIEHADGTVVEGLGVLPGRAVEGEARATDDIVVRSKYGTLVGFENHARDYIAAEGSPIGRLQHGSGNGRDSGQEGVTMGDVIGTHLHGPVLALNPHLADHIISAMYTRAGGEYVRGEHAAIVDDYARAARNHIARKLELPLD